MTVTIHTGDCRKLLRQLGAGTVQTCVTSPPYFGLRDYGNARQIGLEQTPAQYVRELVKVFRQVRRVLRDDGTLWLNLGDSYANDSKWGRSSGGKHARALHGNSSIGRTRVTTGLKSKDLIGIPWRVAFALQADGWYLRQDIIWSKPNPMPESVKDRCTKAHEYLFLLSKGPRYYFDADAISEEAEFDGPNGRQQSPYAQGFARRSPDEESERRSKRYSFARATSTQGVPGAQAQHRADRKDVDYAGRRNKRSVWTVSTRPFPDAHFATFPPELIEPCVLAGSPVGGLVLDPFGGAGTTGLVAEKLGRDSILLELNPEYASMAHRRTMQRGFALGSAA